MSREMRNLLAAKAAKVADAQALINKDGVTAEEIQKVNNEIAAINAKIETQKAIDEGKKFDENGVEVTETPQSNPQNKTPSYSHAFANLIRRKATADDMEVIRSTNALTPLEGEDGGLIVPEDVSTAINQYKRELINLRNFVTVYSTSTNKGSRVFEKLETMVALTKITDLDADIADAGSPKFVELTFAIDDYAGILTIPNDLKNDTDQALLDYIARWIARKVVVTENSLILANWNAISATAFADETAIKKALNVTLDPMLAAGAVIITNQDGFQYLDTLRDGNGNPVLQPVITDPTKKLFAGKPITVLSNSQLPTTGTTPKLAPVYVGNTKEATALFERQGYQIDSTNIGGSAFTKNRTEVRVIERLDVVTVDSGALIHGTLDVTSVA